MAQSSSLRQISSAKMEWNGSHTTTETRPRRFQAAAAAVTCAEGLAVLIVTVPDSVLEIPGTTVEVQLWWQTRSALLLSGLKAARHWST